MKILDEVQGRTRFTKEAYSMYDEEGTAVLTQKFANIFVSHHEI